MPSLEKKIPPPVLLLLVLVLTWRIAKVDHLLELPRWFAKTAAIILALAGNIIPMSAVISFCRAQTTVNPLKPESASQLVSLGVFKYTGNPMYVGLVALACAAAVYASSVFSLLLVVLLAAYLDQFQIVPEERAMAKLFGAPYVRYKNSVRRWCHCHWSFHLNTVVCHTILGDQRKRQNRNQW
jgi:protein-S-isoprenylcysteine O-methyltransferase Ste14